MNGTERETGKRRHTGWDALIAALLGVALTVGGGLDVLGYLRHRGKPQPDFAFMELPTIQNPGDFGVYHHIDSLAVLENVSGLETNRGLKFRQALGPRTALVLWTQRTRALLNLQWYNLVVDQDTTVCCNGRVLELFTHQPEALITRRYPLDLRPGRNEITIAFARYNHAGADLSPDDARPLAGTFTQFDLTLE